MGEGDASSVHGVSQAHVLGCTERQYVTPPAALVAPNGYKGTRPASASVEQPSFMSRFRSGRIPVGSGSHHTVEDGQQFSCIGGESHLLRLSGFEQPLVEIA